MFRSNIRLTDVRRLLRSAEELELSAGAIQRLKWFLFALEHDGNVSLTCRHFGISRSTFLRWAGRFDATDIRSLEEHSRKPHTVRRPETDAKVVALITAIRIAEPLLGKESIQKKLAAEHGIAISSSTVGRIITRHRLFFAETPAHREKRSREETKSEVSIDTKSIAPTQKADEGDQSDTLSLFPASGFTS